jgi:hypothetical protein
MILIRKGRYPLEDEQQHNEHNRDPLSDFLFGPRRPRRDEKEQLPVIQEEPETQSVDLSEMMIHFDTLMESYSNLKPLFSKIQPLIQMVWKSK